MRGSIFTMVAVGVGVALTPAILNIDVSGDAVGQSTLDVLGPMETILPLVFFIVVWGLITAFYVDSY